MIGIYNYTVVLTYMSLCSSVFGMTQAIHGHFKIAIFCLALSGLCDMFDGKVARSKKDRTDDEKAFGIQIDSLCDVVCFGIFPAMICYLLGVRGPIGLLLIAFYCINSVIRLAYFNVMEAKRQSETSENRKYYQGLPITSMSVIMPLLFVVSVFFPGFRYFLGCLHIAMLLVGFLFIFNFRFRKPTNQELVVLVSVVGVAVLFILFYKEGWWTKYGLRIRRLKGV